MSDGADSEAFEGMTSGSSGFNGVGKMIIACTSVISSCFDVGLVKAVGPDAAK